MSNQKTTEIFLTKSKIIHGDKYIYSKVEYIRSNKPVIIICHLHGEFMQIPSVHLNGHGCNLCGKLAMSDKLTHSNEEFINRCIEVHHNFYDYSLTVFTHINNKIEIICPTHGLFIQKANAHVNGSGCSKCATVTSKSEISWLDSLGIPNENRHITLKINNKRFLVDGYDPSSNTVYEFYGDFWHGNPNVFTMNEFNKVTKCTFGELLSKTLEKENIIKKAGLNFIKIWEFDWKQQEQL